MSDQTANETQDYEIPADWDVSLNRNMAEAERRGYHQGWIDGLKEGQAERKKLIGALRETTARVAECIAMEPETGNYHTEDLRNVRDMARAILQEVEG